MQCRGSREIAAKMRRRGVLVAGCTRPNSPHFGQSPVTLADMISFLFISTKKPLGSLIFQSDTQLERATQPGSTKWQPMFVIRRSSGLWQNRRMQRIFNPVDTNANGDFRICPEFIDRFALRAGT